MSLIKNYIEGKLTKLNQLKYGSFNVGREPIIQKTIPTGISEQGPSYNETSKRADDLARVVSLVTRPEGLRYLSNESMLGGIRTKGTAQVEGKQSLLGNLTGGTFNAVKALGSTLAQVPVNGTGIHFIKGFGGRKGYLGRSFAGEVKQGSKVGIRDFDRFPQSVNFPEWKPSQGLVYSSNGKKEGSSDVPDSEINAGADAIRLDSEEALKTATKRNIENRVGLGELGKKTLEQRQSPYVKKLTPGQHDTINLLEPTLENFKDKPESRDLAKFRFQVINPDNPSQETFLYFRALLDGIGDSYSGNWNTVQYTGRGESFYNYSGFERSISLSFKVAAMSRQELRPIYKKLNYLASTTAPSVSKDGFMRGTIIKLTVGSLFYELPGFIESIELSWNNAYPWEIALSSKDEGSDTPDKDVQELPMVLDVSLNYRPLHKFAPSTGDNLFITNDTRNSFNDPIPKDE